MSPDIIDRIKLAVEISGRSHWQVSKDAGFANTFLRDLFKNVKKNINTGNLEALAAQLNTSLGWLLTGAGDPPQPPANSNPPRLYIESARRSRGAEYAKILGRTGGSKK